MKRFIFIHLIAATLVFAGCKLEPLQTAGPTPAPTVVEETTSLSWEKNHPERAAWSKVLALEVKDAFQTLQSAKDITRICPKFGSLTDADKISALSEFWIAVSYYESGWDQESQSVDVGSKSKPDTWSIGLWQMSVVDQESYNLPLGYKFKDLLTVGPSAKLSIKILEKQVKRTGKIILKKGVDSGVYWAVIYDGGTYDKSAKIIARTQEAFPKCK